MSTRLDFVMDKKVTKQKVDDKNVLDILKEIAKNLDTKLYNLEVYLDMLNGDFVLTLWEAKGKHVIEYHLSELGMRYLIEDNVENIKKEYCDMQTANFNFVSRLYQLANNKKAEIDEMKKMVKKARKL
jgi:hypothetical protein